MKMKLAENIRKLRKERSLTQEQLSEALGVTAGAENGGIGTKGVPCSRDGFDARAVEGFFNGMLTIAPGV